jgi:hypothetical protein
MTNKRINNSLNNTLEEELRVMLVDKNNENRQLRAQVKILEDCVAEEQEAKYRAWIKLADLKKGIDTTE